MDFMCDQFLTRPGLPQDENGGFGWGHQFDLANELPKDSALAYQIAESFGLDNLLLQIGIAEFQLRLETLDFLKGLRIGHHGGNMVTNNGAPRPDILILANVSTKVPRQHT